MVAMLEEIKENTHPKEIGVYEMDFDSINAYQWGLGTRLNCLAKSQESRKGIV